MPRRRGMPRRHGNKGRPQRQSSDFMAMVAFGGIHVEAKKAVLKVFTLIQRFTPPKVNTDTKNDVPLMYLLSNMAILGRIQPLVFGMY